MQVNNTNDFLVQGVLEDFIDGIMIFTEQGDLVYANSYAQQIHQQLQSDSSQAQLISPALWQLCQPLLDSKHSQPEKPLIIESQISTHKLDSWRIRVQWFDLDSHQPECLLLTLENQNQATKNLVLAEVKKYGLTPREQEVWLLRRAKYTYKDIAAELSITINTVKKHLTNIYAKIELHQIQQQPMAVNF